VVSSSAVLFLGSYCEHLGGFFFQQTFFA
jgi:hypothetical protein